MKTLFWKSWIFVYKSLKNYEIYSTLTWLEHFDGIEKYFIVFLADPSGFSREIITTLNKIEFYNILLFRKTCNQTSFLETHYFQQRKHFKLYLVYETQCLWKRLVCFNQTSFRTYYMSSLVRIYKEFSTRSISKRKHNCMSQIP